MDDELKILSAEDIMAAQDITEKTVPVPEWGGAVRVRSISYRDMQKIKKQAKTGEDGDADEDLIEKYILMKGMVEPIIDDDQYEHLINKSAGAVMTVLKEIMGNSSVDTKAVKKEEKSLPAES